MRLTGGQAPKMDRYYAEQIVGYLICENYLREDFHFTPYATLAYIKRGEKDAAVEASILFDRARILDLPALGATTNGSADNQTTSESDSRKKKQKNGKTSSDDVEFVSESKLKVKRKSRSSSKRTTDEDANVSSSSGVAEKAKSSRMSLEALAVERENKRRKVFEEDALNVSQVRADGISDDVLVLQTNGIIIEID